MAKKTFSVEYLRDELDLPWAAIEDEVVDNSRWSIFHDIVFQDPADGKFYATGYSVGATEMQDEGPWQYEDTVEATEVEKREVIVTKWVTVKDDGR